MADEAFALSPISARAAQPSEEDYAAISEAFMETSRGRWFLGEYAKRNRNADTRLVLDAVARIEETITAQKQAADDTSLADALAAVRAAVGEARATTTAALDGLALDQHLASIRKGARVMREIAWRLREIGADGRICDIIDLQAAVIETSAGEISASPARDAQDAAFAALMAQIEEFSRDDNAGGKARQDANVVPFPAPMEETAAVVVVETAAVADAVTEIVETSEAASVAPMLETAAGSIEPESELGHEAADAHNEAMLDLIAAEMAAPQPDDDIDDLELTLAEPAVAEAAPVVAEPAAQDGLDGVDDDFIAIPAAVQPIAAPVASTSVATQPPIEPVAASPSAESTANLSLGSSILASGILKKPVVGNDPLAPIRRMSQAEKVAFFS